MSKKIAQCPLILRCHRLMDAFAKSDDERDYYLDRNEGFIVYVDLDKSQEELDVLENEVLKNTDRYCMIPKLTFYETKKIMEGFVHDKVYDIDTKEKLLDIIQSKEARDNFLEFIYDHHHEFEKWQQFFQERSRIRIIEWLRDNNFHFVFEEDLEMPIGLIEKLKRHLFDNKVNKEIEVARKTMTTKAKNYYSNEALNPRPKRGRPPKQQLKQEVEPQVTSDMYSTVPSSVRPFLYTPDISSVTDVTFSAKFESKDRVMASRKQPPALDGYANNMESINQKLATLRELTGGWADKEELVSKKIKKPLPLEEDEEGEEKKSLPKKEVKKKIIIAKPKAKEKPKETSTKGKRLMRKVSPEKGKKGR